jgi:hypothetical protein
MEGRTRRKDHGRKGAYLSLEYAGILRIGERSDPGSMRARGRKRSVVDGKRLESSRDCRDGIKSKSVDQRVALIRF